MEHGNNIYIAGHRGLVGSAFLRALKQRGYRNLLTCIHAELDLTRKEAVSTSFNLKGRNMSFWQQQRLGAYWPTTTIRQTSFIKV